MGGVRSGVNGTPTFFVDGMRYDGILDEQSLEAGLRQRIAHNARAAESGDGDGASLGLGVTGRRCLRCGS